MQVNEEKRKKFMEFAGKRVNNVLHDIQILEPMSRSTTYDFTKQDVDEMFNAMQETLNNAKLEFEKKFDEKARSEKKVFSFGAAPIDPSPAGFECSPCTSTVETPASVCTCATPVADEPALSASPVIEVPTDDTF